MYSLSINVKTSSREREICIAQEDVYGTLIPKYFYRIVLLYYRPFLSGTDGRRQKSVLLYFFRFRCLFAARLNSALTVLNGVRERERDDDIPELLVSIVPDVYYFVIMYKYNTIAICKKKEEEEMCGDHIYI